MDVEQVIQLLEKLSLDPARVAPLIRRLQVEGLTDDLREQVDEVLAEEEARLIVAEAAVKKMGTIEDERQAKLAAIDQKDQHVIDQVEAAMNRDQIPQPTAPAPAPTPEPVSSQVSAVVGSDPNPFVVATDQSMPIQAPPASIADATSPFTSTTTAPSTQSPTIAPQPEISQSVPTVSPAPIEPIIPVPLPSTNPVSSPMPATPAAPVDASPAPVEAVSAPLSPTQLPLPGSEVSPATSPASTPPAASAPADDDWLTMLKQLEQSKSAPEPISSTPVAPDVSQPVVDQGIAPNTDPNMQQSVVNSASLRPSPSLPQAPAALESASSSSAASIPTPVPIPITNPTSS